MRYVMQSDIIDSNVKLAFQKSIDHHHSPFTNGLFDEKARNSTKQKLAKIKTGKILQKEAKQSPILQENLVRCTSRLS